MIFVIHIWISLLIISAPQYQRETWYSNVLIVLYLRFRHIPPIYYGTQFWRRIRHTLANHTRWQSLNNCDSSDINMKKYFNRHKPCACTSKIWQTTDYMVHRRLLQAQTTLKARRSCLPILEKKHAFTLIISTIGIRCSVPSMMAFYPYNEYKRFI